MDPAKLKEFLESDEGKAAIAAAAEKDVTGLKTKNQELLDGQAKLKGRLERFEGIDPDTYKSLVELKKELDEKKRKDLHDEGDHDKIMEQMKTDFATENEKKDKLIESLTNENRQLIISQSMTEAMGKANIAEPYHEAFVALVGNKVAIAEDDDGKRAVVGDKSVSDYVSEFVGTDQGKHFVKAPGNSGGGASGSSGTGTKPANPFAGDKPDLAAGAELMRSDPMKAKTLMKEAGMPALDDM